MSDALDEWRTYYDTLIERWRSLSDGERLTLIAQCCPRCGALKEKGVTHRRPRTEPCCKAPP